MENKIELISNEQTVEENQNNKNTINPSNNTTSKTNKTNITLFYKSNLYPSNEERFLREESEKYETKYKTIPSMPSLALAFKKVS